MSEMLHVLALTSGVWSFVFDHIDFFLQVIQHEHVLLDPERLRIYLTPYHINHINLRNYAEKFSIVSRKEQIMNYER